MRNLAVEINIRSKMETVLTKNTGVGVSSVDALWTLIMQQAKSTRKALVERLFREEVETAEQFLLKSSLQRGWQQVKEMERSGKDYGTLQDLITKLG